MIGRLILPIAVMATLIGSPAALGDELELSLDGASWHTDLRGGLFGGDRKWIPGETRQAMLLVRNTAPTSGVISLVLTGPTQSPLYQQLVVRGRLGEDTWSNGLRLVLGQPLVLGEIPAGEAKRLRVRLSVSPHATRAAARRTALVGMTFRLDQVRAAEALPDTGALRWEGWFVAGITSVLTGAWLILARRRRREVTS
jgi:LPXTG-motif cell wall-anchored protein